MSAKHEPCRCGCGELADECMGGGNPLAAFTIEEPAGNFAEWLGVPCTSAGVPCECTVDCDGVPIRPAP